MAASPDVEGILISLMPLLIGVFAAGAYFHGDGHSLFITQFGWFFGTFFLVAVVTGLGLGLRSLGGGIANHFRNQVHNFGTFILVAFVPYFLGALAGDLYHYTH